MAFTLLDNEMLNKMNPKYAQQIINEIKRTAPTKYTVRLNFKERWIHNIAYFDP